MEELIFGFIMVVLLLIFAVQNKQNIPVCFFGIQLNNVPLFLVIILLAALGFVIGYIID